jgi:PAS domain S-box-containing protein
MVFVKDAESLKFVRFNKASEEILGISQQEMMGKNDYDFFPPDEAKHFIDDDRRVLAGDGVVDIPEEVIQTRHRGARILHTRKIPVFDSDGKPEFLLGISEDITELKKAQEASLRLAREEAALKEQAAIARRLEFLSEASKALGSSLDYRISMEKLASIMVPGVLDWCTMNIRKEGDVFERVVVLHRDPEKLELTKKLRAVNRSVAFSTGAEEGKGGNGPMGAMIASGRSVFYPEVSDEILRGTCETEEQFQILKQLGVRSQIVAPIRVREKILGAMVCCMSESNRRFEATDLQFFEEIGARTGLAIENALLYEAAQDAIVARDEFLSVASHELKTPITSLNLLLEMSQRVALAMPSPESERLLQSLSLCQAQSKRLSAFVDDLLDVSRMKSGKLSMINFPIS